MNDSYDNRYQTTPFFGGNAPYVESKYEQYLQNPESVEAHWRDYFRSFDAAVPGSSGQPRGPVEAELAARAHLPRHHTGQGLDLGLAEKQAAVIRLIQAFRGRGYIAAALDPLSLHPVPQIPDLTLEFHGLDQGDMDTVFSTVSLTGPDRMPLRDIWDMLKEVYTGHIGFEYGHVTNSEERLWIKQAIESARRVKFDDEKRMEILRSLTAAEGIEKYLHTRYVGQKRFSLEGGESLIPLLHDLVEQAERSGAREIVIGMAHRGRINVLINVLGKSPGELFSEFEGVYDPRLNDRSGDVKYHLGFSSDIETSNGQQVHVALAFNPSHLEIVNPVVEGSVRARQDRRSDELGKEVMPVLIHGDAAFAGQGVVMETLQLSQARGFHTGGTLHVVVNNQVGFTISNPHDARSTPYCTDVAKMLEAPVFHVNGDDPEAVVFLTRLALEYRAKFRKDVFIDLVCYRRHGHNEADEPAATQPLMYQAIKSHPTVRQLYADRLREEGLVNDGEVTAMVEEYRNELDTGEKVAPAIQAPTNSKYAVDWSRYNTSEWHHHVDTSIGGKRLHELAAAMVSFPEEVILHNRVARIYKEREKMLAGETPMDWGFAETLAYASLLTDGYAVRLCGQDSGRGTFFHRHAVLHNQKDGSTYIPLQHIAADQQRFTIVDSLLSEEAVVGFEYGYSTAEPETLDIWEAQFGDFANGAQVVVDQFISSGEAKWGRLCGLVLFLPHGYEGQGPEHSSARMERYLQLCAEHNMQVCVPTTPAQMFHMLRRQMLHPFRKPLIVMTPKSLLRHRLSVSSLEDIEKGHFHVVIPETENLQPDKVRRVIFCSGKLYYDLLEARRADEIRDVAIVRIEQLYPFPRAEYAAIINTYRRAREIIWCQEEPENQGAWYQIRHRLQESLSPDHTLNYAGRSASASTAAGYFKLHVEEQKALISEALGTASDRKKAAGERKTTGKTVSEKA